MAPGKAQAGQKVKRTAAETVLLFSDYQSRKSKPYNNKRSDLAYSYPIGSGKPCSPQQISPSLTKGSAMNPRIRVTLNKGRKGVLLGKLAIISEETTKFLASLGNDLGTAGRTSGPPTTSKTDHWDSISKIPQSRNLRPTNGGEDSR